MTYLLLALAFALGGSARRREGPWFAVAFRGQLLGLTSAIALLTGWTAPLHGEALVTIALLQATELTALFGALRLVAAGRLLPPVATAAGSNSGFWAIPVAGALFGADGAAFAALYDITSVARGLVVVRIMRRHAPNPPSPRSALIDYSPQAALVLGLGLRQLVAPPALGPVLPVLGIAVGVAGFALLGMAMPPRPPARADLRAALPAFALRFLPASAVCTVAAVAGLSLPPAAWVVALAPAPFAPVAMARLYGYRREPAAAVPALTVPAALALVPIAAFVG